MGYKTAPQVVRQTFDELKRSLNKPLSLHVISGSYYVYEYSSAKSAKSSKTVIKTFYIGHITEHGKFIAKGQKELAGLEVREGHDQPAGEPYDEREAIVLRNLSMNGRMSMAKLAKRVGMSVTGTRHFVKRMEEKYNIRYFAEVNTLKLGFLRYIALVKFEEKIPSVQEVKEAFKDDSHVALVAMTKGIYDMIVIFYLEAVTPIANFVYEWRKSTALPDYTARWYVTPFSIAFGTTMPFRKEVAKGISESLVKNKDKSGLIAKLSQNEGLVFKELLLNGNLDFKDIDKSYGLNQGRSNYAFYKLKEKEIIERVTVTINPLNLRYNAIFITETNNYKKFIENQDKRRLDIISQKGLVNKDAIRGDIGTPDSVLHIRPIFEESDFQEFQKELKATSGTDTYNMVITDIVIGSLCYRNFDYRHTPIYDLLVKHDRLQPKEKIEY